MNDPEGLAGTQHPVSQGTRRRIAHSENGTSDNSDPLARCPARKPPNPTGPEKSWVRSTGPPQLSRTAHYESRAADVLRKCLLTFPPLRKSFAKRDFCNPPVPVKISDVDQLTHGAHASISDRAL